MKRCLFGKTVSKFLVAALTLTMVMTVIEPVGSYAAEEDEEKKAEAEVVVEAEEAPAEEEKAEEPEKKEEAKEEKEPEKKETKKKTASEKKLSSIDDLTFTLTAKIVTSDLYKRKDGVLKAEFEVAWSDSDAYNALIDSGWNLTYTLKDVASGKDLGYAEGKKYTVTSSQNEGYSLVVKAEKEGETTKTVKDTTTRVKFPSKTKKVTAKCPSTSRTVTLKWTKVSGASGYYIYRNTKKVKPSKPYKKISKGSKVKFEDKKMKGKKTYYYWIQTIKSFKRDGESYKTVSVLSKPDKVVVNKFLTCKIRTIKWYTITKKPTKIYKSKTGSAVKETVPKGTKIFVPFIKNPRRPSKRMYAVNYKGWIDRWSVIGEDAKGDVALINHKALDWSKEEKEAFVNKKGFSSSTGYLAWTSQYTQRVNIFKGRKGHWKLIRSMRCTTGRWSRRTGNSSHLQIRSHQARKDKTSETGYRYYYINLSIINGNAFHSPAWRFGTKHCIKAVKNNLQPDTAGCTRMSVANSSYIYHNIPLHTRVVIF